MKRSYPIVAVLSILGLGLAFAGEESASESAVPDSEIGLRKGSVFETLSPPVVAANESSPGEVDLPARPNEEAPPVVPHGIVDFLPITRDSNMCVDCHAIEEKEAGEPTPIPASHYVDLRNAPGKKATEVAGARYLCISCHVAQTATEPLVGNSAAAPTSE